MRSMLTRRRALHLVLVALALIVACGPGDACEDEREKEERQFRENQQFMAAFTPPLVTGLEASLKVPVTTYSVTAIHPGQLPLSYEWSMSGEECGTPKVAWKQNGASVSWSHSDQSPDNCQHKGTDHAVVATVVVRTSSGQSVVCTIRGTETQKIERPQCASPTPTPTPTGTAASGR